MSCCKSCKTKATEEWRDSNRLAWNEYVKARSKRQDVREKIIAYRQSEHAKKMAKARESTAYRREQKRIWRATNRDKVQQYSRNKHAKRRVAMDGTIDPITAKQWRDLVMKFRSRCYYCGRRGKMTVEHMTPLSRGGNHSIDNIVPACLPCNVKKHANDNYEFARRFGRLF